MSAEQLVENIINQALATAQQKTELAAQYASQAMSIAAGSVAFDPASVSGRSQVTVQGTLRADKVPTPRIKEPEVSIPTKASGLDQTLFNTTSSRIIGDLANRFATFFRDYFPVGPEVSAAYNWLLRAINGSTGIPTHVEDQIWQRDRARVLQDVRRTGEEVVSAFASRGFPLPPGAMQHQLHLTNQIGLEKIAQASRDTAIKQVEIAIENARFAVQQVLDYRIKAIQAAADYIKALALGPQIAAQLATSSADAQAKLISAASSYYDSRIRAGALALDAEKFEQSLKLDAAKTNATLRLDAAKVNAVQAFDLAKTNATLHLEAGKANVGAWTELIRNRTQAALAAATSAGTQAAAALNAVHASAAVAVQGETG